MKKFIFIKIFILWAAVAGLAQGDIEAFDKYVDAARKQWNVPGMSITVVRDGKVLFTKGYGVRELGKTETVDTSTLFGCMSTTKAMTAVAMGILVDEGKVNWDDKVTKYLPDFRIADPYVTSELRVRDLLTHNSGLDNTDFLWAWTPELSSAEVVRRMQYAKPVYSMRGGFIYQNIMFLVAGQVIERASGMSWERFVTERIFVPLGMKNSFANYALSRNYQNRSSAHFEIKGRIEPIPEMVADAIAPAGAVWSTADDISKWVLFMLGNTTVDGKQLLKNATLAEILKPQTIVPPSGFYPTIALTRPHWMTYGFGWFQHDYRGEMVDFHTGSLDGRTAIIGMIPDKKVGVYIFGNLDHAEVRHALMYKALDTFGFADASRDWSTEMKTLYDGIKANGAKQIESIMAMRMPNTHPSLPLDAYAGKYSDPFYGTAEVKLIDGKLKLIIGRELSADMEPWQFDSFQVTWNKRWWEPDLVKFALSAFAPSVESIDIGGAVLKKLPKAK